MEMKPVTMAVTLMPTVMLVLMWMWMMRRTCLFVNDVFTAV